MENAFPETMQEAILHFTDAEVCRKFVMAMRWPEGVTCPHCGAGDPYFLETVRVWKCREKDCRKKFSVKVGTIFEDSPLPLSKWLPAMWIVVNAKNGVSSYEIHRSLGVTQKTAWFMDHRIRTAMATGSLDKLEGTVEADETLIGGILGNMHADRKAHAKGLPNDGKIIVMGLMERNGKVRSKVIANAKKTTLQPLVKQHVKKGSEVFTDALASYEGLSEDFIHAVINHAERYVDGRVHTNSIENYWSLFKRCIKGTYVSVEPWHLFRYLDEEDFRFNTRKLTDSERFVIAVAGVAGKRLTYKDLIGTDGQIGIGM